MILGDLTEVQRTLPGKFRAYRETLERKAVIFMQLNHLRVMVEWGRGGNVWSKQPLWVITPFFQVPAPGPYLQGETDLESALRNTIQDR